jgi:uncharacterized protein YkwD
MFVRKDVGMRAATRTRRMLAVGLVGALAFTTLTAEPAGAVTRREQRLFRWINQERTERGISRLRLSDSLSRKAHRHSRNMADRGTVSHHSCLSCTLRNYNYSIAGENVGRASKMWRVHKLFMGSKTHRQNILRSGFKKVGVGVVKARGYIWVTEIFIG